MLLGTVRQAAGPIKWYRARWDSAKKGDMRHHQYSVELNPGGALGALVFAATAAGGFAGGFAAIRAREHRVRVLQAQLLLAGTYEGALSGQCDEATLAALNAYQKSIGQPVITSRFFIPRAVRERLASALGVPDVAGPFLSGPMLSNPPQDGGTVLTLGRVFEHEDSTTRISSVSAHRGFACGVAEVLERGQSVPIYAALVQVAPTSEVAEFELDGKKDVDGADGLQTAHVTSTHAALIWAKDLIDRRYLDLLGARRRLLSGGNLMPSVGIHP